MATTTSRIAAKCVLSARDKGLYRFVKRVKSLHSLSYVVTEQGWGRPHLTTNPVNSQNSKYRSVITVPYHIEQKN